MDYSMYVVLVLVMVVMVVLHCVNLYNDIEPPKEKLDLQLFDNSNVPDIVPPEVIIIESNELSCHETLTECRTDAQCQLCQEALAKCYTFQDTVILELPNGDSQTMRPGDSYCLALDSKRARSCNPHTGTWVMRQVDTTNYAIICHCDFPGLVIQATIYDDCDIEVGCRPNGHIANLYETPLTCACDTGYHPDRNEHGPFCRPTVVRDMQNNPAFFHRPPCRNGYITNRHPGLHETIQRLFMFEVCIPDPCRIDPVTGQWHEGGNLEIFPGEAPDGTDIVMCYCSIEQSLYPVYSPQSIVDARYGRNDPINANACIQPLTIDQNQLRTDLKVFWGQNSFKSNADMVIQTNFSSVKERYRRLLRNRTTAHPVQIEINVSNILKFQITSVYFTTAAARNARDIYQMYWAYNYLRTHQNHCPIAGLGQCRRGCNAGNVSVSCSDCINSTVASNYNSQCFFVRDSTRSIANFGTFGQICSAHNAWYYPAGLAPICFYLTGRFATDWQIRNAYRTIQLVHVHDALQNPTYDAANSVLDSYPWYRRAH
ncbi:pif-1 [Spodoptera frugiperda granulovirus]|uniref:Pif-1 n=1 Tax=Spodoptera frugiperda granulovirus TaxID=307454 RepID=A0A0C5B339_9BBAC|nr:pif-1 [Spodoptera frugiperda granulovirus]AJK91730.1 pif-1 [Spodoptera frugiperda granulovirus]AXS01092.1 pif-1 [Spodoptera frugiperda granulovirus]